MSALEEEERERERERERELPALEELRNWRCVVFSSRKGAKDCQFWKRAREKSCHPWKDCENRPCIIFARGKDLKIVSFGRNDPVELRANACIHYSRPRRFRVTIGREEVLT